MFDSFRLLSSEQKHAVTNWTPTRGIYATINMYDIFSLLSVVNSIRLHSNLFCVCLAANWRKSVKSICGYAPERERKGCSWKMDFFSSCLWVALRAAAVFTSLSKSFFKKFWVAHLLVSNSFEFVVLAMNGGGRGNLIPLWRSYDSPFVILAKRAISKGETFQLFLSKTFDLFSLSLPTAGAAINAR